MAPAAIYKIGGKEKPHIIPVDNSLDTATAAGEPCSIESYPDGFIAKIGDKGETTRWYTVDGRNRLHLADGIIAVPTAVRKKPKWLRWLTEPI